MLGALKNAMVGVHFEDGVVPMAYEAMRYTIDSM